VSSTNALCPFTTRIYAVRVRTGIKQITLRRRRRVELPYRKNYMLQYTDFYTYATASNWYHVSENPWKEPVAGLDIEQEF
jgi:hypothetical protein